MKSDNLNNVIKMDDYIIIPEGYESDIIVDMNDTFDWKKIDKISDITDYHELYKK